ncbi:acyl-CoA dehydrogenase family protein [Streptomyces sp. R39]|uniref:Acyl-CoA dehydrogenase family protein n=1 Tax=Streptomyces sp. R39 TaxID=3238631 RepID=A0AB39R755_9ACTN
MSIDAVDMRPAGVEPVARAVALATTLAEHAAETEQSGRLAPASVAAVRDAGLLALTVPRELGGLGADLRTLAQVAMALGAACPSTAWVTSLSCFSKKSVGAGLRGPVRSAYFADPHALVCATAVAEGHGRQSADGLRLSGRWRMASGCEDAAWAFLIVPVLRQDTPAGVGTALVPVGDLVVERSWRSAGLAGTGSHTLLAEDVVVPPEYTTSPADRCTPPPAAVTVGAVVAHLAPMIGAAHGALAVLQGVLAGTRAPSQTTYSRLVDSPLARHRFGQASHLIDTATRRVLDVAGQLDATDPAHPVPSLERTQLRMRLVSAAAECRQAVEWLLDLHGAGGFDPGNPLQRFWRDVSVGTRYAGLNPYVTEEDHDRLLLGIEPPVSLAL